jgi:hypothetical protein
MQKVPRLGSCAGVSGAEHLHITGAGGPGGTATASGKRASVTE